MTRDTLAKIVLYPPAFIGAAVVCAIYLAALIIEQARRA
jgi:hypothetical protein